MFNLKGDEHLESIDNALDIDFDYVPKKKDYGLYRLSVSPYDLEGSPKQESVMDQYLKKLWEREHIGLFFDETYPLGNSKALVLCLTQGRSKRIPMILNTQRPVWITRFAFSEASFIQVYDLNDERDIDTVESFVPFDWDKEPPLKEFQSWYYDIGKNTLVRLNPVPDMDRIRERFEEKWPRK